jgi:YD repeat-containing protein
LEPRQYLPFAANNAGANTSVNDGRIKISPVQQQAVFYNSASSQSPIAGQGETFFYSEQKFEPSPRNVVVKSMGPGNSWVGSGKGTEIKTFFLAENDSLVKWKVTDNSAAAGGSAGPFGVYQAILNEYPGNLTKAVTINENGKQTIQFTDDEGNLILSKVQLTASPDTGTGRGYAGWLCTYYIYDDFSRLRCIIQPKGVEQLAANSWQLTTTLLDEQCFRYEYDSRGRMIQKKLPGAGATCMV